MSHKVVPVEGADVNIYVYRGGVPVLTACATGCSIEFSMETISRATIDTGTVDDYEAGMQTCTVTLQGVTTLDELPSWQVDDFVDNMRQKLRVLFVLTNSYGDRMAYDFFVLTNRVSMSGDVTDFSNWEAGMQRCGAHTKTKVFQALQDTFGNYLLDSEGYLIR